MPDRPANKPAPEIAALIVAAAAKYGIPYELLYAQVQQESAFNPLAVSRCGARGLLQIMPATWRELTGKDADANNYIFEPEKNLDAGARYLKKLYTACQRQIACLPPRHSELTKTTSPDDIWKLALASYNCGMGYIFKAINICIADNIALTWESIAIALSDKRCLVKGHDPEEKQTIAYVERIWAHYKGAKA